MTQERILAEDELRHDVHHDLKSVVKEISPQSYSRAQPAGHTLLHRQH